MEGEKGERQRMSFIKAAAGLMSNTFFRFLPLNFASYFYFFPCLHCILSLSPRLVSTICYDTSSFLGAISFPQGFYSVLVVPHVVTVTVGGEREREGKTQPSDWKAPFTSSGGGKLILDLSVPTFAIILRLCKPPPNLTIFAVL